MSDIKEKLTADEQAYLDKMKASLRELGVSLTSGIDIHEQARVINNRAFALAADGIYAKRAPYTDGVNPVDNPAQKLTAAQAYIVRLEAGLHLLGVDPSGDIKRQTDDITNRQMSDNDAAEHDLACAVSERDGARIMFDDLLTKLNIDPRLSPEMRAKAILQICEESNTLGLIAEHLGLSRLDPDAVRRRVQSDAVDLKVSRERVAKVEALLAEECSRGDNARHALSVLGIIGDDLIGQAKSHAQRSTDPARDYDAEIRAARIDALKTLGVNPYDPPVCVIGAAKKRATTLEHAQKFEDDVTAVWELWGAGCEVKPGALHELCQEQERLNTKLQMKIGAATEHLDNAGIPKGYGHDQKGNPVPFEERVALLAEAYKDASWMRDKWHDSTQNAATEIDDAHTELTALGAPRRAGDLALSLAARIRALPDLLRP